MITPADISKKAERLYAQFLRSIVTGEAFFPVEIRFRKVRASDSFSAVRQSVERLVAGSGANGRGGYSVHLEEVNTRRFGKQRLPQRITIDGEDDFLALLNRRREANQFRQDVSLLHEAFPQLEGWMASNPTRVLAHAKSWPDLIAVCRYFVANPRPNLYIRELPVEVHTKFVEAHRGILTELLEELLPEEALDPSEAVFEKRFGLRYDEPLLRLRFLDPELQRAAGSPVSDLSAPLREFASLRLSGVTCVITENRMNFLTLPALPGVIGIWGSGFRVGLLKEVPWLTRCRLIYWGDIDAHGFQILSQLRSAFQEVESVMMDARTLETFGAYITSGTPAPRLSLPHLTDEERRLYLHVAERKLRLEQEKISQTYAMDALRRMHEEKSRVGRAENR